AQQIWAEEVNAKGGLLGRPVKYVYYDDQSSVGTIPGIYAKLLDVDKVELLMGAATNLIVAAMPAIMERKRMVMVLLALAVNDEFHYPRYFQTAAFGPEAKGEMSRAFFEVAKSLDPAPKTVALVGADAEFSHNVLTGARANVKKNGLQIVYDRTYPPATVDYTPIVRAIQAANPDIVTICSYPLDSVGMVKAVNELNYRPRMIGGAMVGLQATVFKRQLGPLLNGWVNYETWVPAKALTFDGTEAFLKQYQARAGAEGVDPLGYYLGTWGYAYIQILGEAVQATKSLDDNKLADYIGKTTFKTIMGDVKFGKGGEWARGRMLQVQYHDIKSGDLEQFRGMDTQTVLTPAQYKTGSVIYPYEKAK
ncbi:MAG: amino acid ABC transporter substrate-binding protein, partial [Hyphomicrobiales bacterium]|nr:amino acid ABC transporter substrate-binding protein [Hyphomicrobiales bacterium]